MGIGDVRAAAELSQEDGQLCCRETRLLDILSFTPNSRNPRSLSEHLLLVGGERARDVQPGF